FTSRRTAPVGLTSRASIAWILIARLASSEQTCARAPGRLSSVTFSCLAIAIGTPLTNAKQGAIVSAAFGIRKPRRPNEPAHVDPELPVRSETAGEHASAAQAGLNSAALSPRANQLP